jgi:hypothetical protein
MRRKRKRKRKRNSTTPPEVVDRQISSVIFPQKIEFLPKMEEFANPASKKYRKNTICTLERKYSKF